jgi:hypothetical protein
LKSYYQQVIRVFQKPKVGKLIPPVLLEAAWIISWQQFLHFVWKKLLNEKGYSYRGTVSSIVVYPYYSLTSDIKPIADKLVTEPPAPTTNINWVGGRKV